MHLRFSAVVLLCLALPPGEPRAQAPPSGITPALQRTVDAAAPGDRLPVWVFLSDKGPARLHDAERSLTPHARARRERNRGAGNLVDVHDLPVRAEYVAALRRDGGRVRHVSRWLNAVSVDLAPETVARIAALPFVRRMDVVRAGASPQPLPGGDVPAYRRRLPASHDYGASASQIQTIGVHTLHDQGLTGAGVWIAMFDTGFNNLSHAVFQNIDVMVTRDFVNGDSVVADELGQMGNGNHGTMTLSVIGGNAPGSLIGPAYGATYILAKTENTDWERHIEEDAWVAAAEWVDSLGADIISSSLGYSGGFTNGETGYTWENMDGNTTIVTIGADIAASRGILVVNSAGNGGTTPLPANTLGAPADGDSVLSVAAVTAGGALASFSSVGPAADGRIKPDVAAMGLSVVVASPFDQASYLTSSGTSFSCPLVAGAAALILEVRPEASNQEIMDAMRATASQSLAPDRNMGWGIINAPAAAAMIPTGAAPRADARLVLHGARPNPFNPSTMIDFELAVPGRVTLAVYDVAGRLVDTLLAGAYRGAGAHSERYQSRRASGVYFVRLTAGGETVSRKIVLLK